MLLDAGLLLGLLQQAPEAWFAWAPSAGAAERLTPEAVEALIAERLAARAAKNWTESDRIRDHLKEQGVLVEDSRDGMRWRYA